MSDVRNEGLARPLGMSFGLHIILVFLLMGGWFLHKEQKAMAPPAMMKAALVYAPKSTMPQQRTQTQKQEKAKPQPEPPKPEPPKPEVVKPVEKPPEVKPVEKPSPVVVKPEPPKPEPKKVEPKKVEPKKAEPKVEPKVEPKKPVEKKTEPPKPDAKQAAKKQAAQSAIQKEKVSKEADMAIQAMLNDEDITRTGALSDEQLGKWVGLIADRIESNWNRPPNARPGMVVILRIQLSNTGLVENVTVVQSSGDRAFDLAAEAAVRKVETFKEITDKMKPEELKMFRDFDLKFDPQDLLM